MLSYLVFYFHLSSPDTGITVMYTQVDNLFVYNLKTSDTLRYTCIELQQQFNVGLSSEQGDSYTNFQL